MVGPVRVDGRGRPRLLARGGGGGGGEVEGGVVELHRDHLLLGPPLVVVEQTLNSEYWVIVTSIID